MLTDTHPWPQLTGKDSLRPGQLSDDIPALREILRRSGMLSPVQTAPLIAAPLVVIMMWRNSLAQHGNQQIDPVRYIEAHLDMLRHGLAKD